MHAHHLTPALITALALAASAPALAGPPTAANKAPTSAAAKKQAAAAPITAPIHEAYATVEAITRARQRGLDGTTLRFIDAPETPNDERLAAVRAIYAHSPKARHAHTYARHLMRQRGATPARFDLARLGTHEALVLGYMLAIERPTTLDGLGGKSEVERAGPVTLLTAAVNRHRGDLSTNLIYGLVKAQLATAQPKHALCAPGRCIDAVLENYTTEWSVRPEAVCLIVASVASSAPKDAQPTHSKRACARVTARADDAPGYARNGQSPGTPGPAITTGVASNSPTNGPQQGRFASPSRGNGPNAQQLQLLQAQLQAMLPPGVTVDVNALMRATPAQQDQMMRQMIGQMSAMLPPQERQMFEAIMMQSQRQLQQTILQHQRMIGATPSTAPNTGGAGQGATLTLQPQPQPNPTAQGPTTQGPTQPAAPNPDDAPPSDPTRATIPLFDADPNAPSTAPTTPGTTPPVESATTGDGPVPVEGGTGASGPIPVDDSVSPGGDIPVDAGTRGAGPVPVDSGL